MISGFLETQSRHFVTSEDVAIGQRQTNAERWIEILEHCREATYTPLYGNFQEAFEKAYTDAIGHDLKGYYDLAELRAEFFHRLFVNSIGMSHCNEWEFTNSHLWSTKLGDKMRAIIGGEEVSHLWLN